MKPTPNPSGNESQSRRTFIKHAATAAAAASTAKLFTTPVYGQSQAPSPGRVIGANDRIAVAYIGLGTQGFNQHLKRQKPFVDKYNIRQAAVCDVYDKRLKAGQEVAGSPDADATRDYRRILERKDIDAVSIATVDNWHADIAIEAMQAGKHVYGEKPLSRYLMEGLRVYDTVKSTGKVFQIGSQYCCDAKYHKAAEWIRAGKLGPLVWAQASYCRNNKTNSEWRYVPDADANESNLDWARWQGKARKFSWDPNRYFSWHLYYDYNSGLLGNLLSHRFIPFMIACDKPEFPRRVVCTGTRKVSTDREITDTTHLLAEMPSGLTYNVVGSTVNELGLDEIIRGRKASLFLAASSNKLELRPQRIVADEMDIETFDDPNPVGDFNALQKDFFDCIRSGQTPKGNIDIAVRANTILCLAEMSERMSLTLLFDEKTRKITTGGGKEIPPLDYTTDAPMST